MQNKKLDTIEEAIKELQKGKAVVVVDDEDRENEGDLVVAAEYADARMINFMSREACGLICITMTAERLQKLKLDLMVENHKNKSVYASPFTMSVDAAEGVTTGISAEERATTIKALISDTATADDIVSPGHMFPLRSHEHGVLGRRGHTEAGVDLMKLSGLYPAAVICEIMNEDGTMARRPQLHNYAGRYKLRIISIEQIVAHRKKRETNLMASEKAQLPTPYGNYDVKAYFDENKREHLALCLGKPKGAPLVRIHSECLTGDVFGSLRCDCGDQLKLAQKRIAEEGSGIIIYLRQEGRGIGLVNKLHAYALQERGLDTVDANLHLGFSADERDFAIAAAILKAQKIEAVRLMTNNLHKVKDLEKGGIRVVERIPLQIESNPENRAYLLTKAEKMFHLLQPELL